MGPTPETLRSGAEQRVTPASDGEAVPTEEGPSQQGLSGTWRAAVADEELRRTYTQDGFDDAGWEPVEVPGHWQSTPAFADTDGPLLYRRAFASPPPDQGRRSWLVLDGVFYQGDVWLD
ncbi:MAG: hypothetical protein KDB35_04035, partial [Acidimicrobiales bacterium]|nr:hypothetical protein [Acidimicrobiales bacterium]